MRVTPTIWLTEGTAVIFTIGKFALSIAAVIVAPQRVLVPHVEVSMAPSTASLRSLPTISSPISVQRFRNPPFPEVE